MFESGLNQIQKSLVLFTLSNANQMWVPFERKKKKIIKNRIQLTCKLQCEQNRCGNKTVG